MRLVQQWYVSNNIDCRLVGNWDQLFFFLLVNSRVSGRSGTLKEAHLAF